MPIYEYRCPRCQAELEKLQRMSEPPPRCERCFEADATEVQMKKLVSQGSFQLKGGGWANEGYG
jgi:putative FmdB family regulatory protein